MWGTVMWADGSSRSSPRALEADYPLLSYAHDQRDTPRRTSLREDPAVAPHVMAPNLGSPTTLRPIVDRGQVSIIPRITAVQTKAVVMTAGETERVTGWEVPQCGQTSSKNFTCSWHARQLRHSSAIRLIWLRVCHQIRRMLPNIRCINSRPLKQTWQVRGSSSLCTGQAGWKKPQPNTETRIEEHRCPSRLNFASEAVAGKRRVVWPANDDRRHLNHRSPGRFVKTAVADPFVVPRFIGAALRTGHRGCAANTCQRPHECRHYERLHTGIGPYDGPPSPSICGGHRKRRRLRRAVVPNSPVREPLHVGRHAAPALADLRSAAKRMWLERAPSHTENPPLRVAGN